MGETFEEKIKSWKSRKNQYEKDDYYYREIFPDVVKHFLKKGRKIIKKKYLYIISVVGFSPQPIILFNELVKPEKHFFICSEETESTIDRVIDYLKLKTSQFSKSIIDSTDVSSIYKSIKEIVRNKDPSKILIDITGGKKSMTGAASLVGGLLNIDLGYVDYTEYFKEERKPKPRTEFPVILENPLVVFGDLEVDKAKALFNNYQFERAEEILDVLENQVQDVWTIRKYKYLSKIYSNWNKFEIKKAIEGIEDLLEKDKHTALEIEPSLRNTLKKHRLILKRIYEVSKNRKEKFMKYKCLNFYFAGERYASIKRYDIAVFLMYRAIESTSQARLIKYGIKPSNASKAQYIKANVTKDMFNTISKNLYGNSYYETNLPVKVALMDGFIILSVKKDPILRGIGLKKILDVTKLRNESVYAHGENPLSEGDYERINRVAKKLVSNYILQESRIKGNPIERYQREFRFPKL